MASKVLVPTAPFAKLQVKKSPPDSGSGYIISNGDAVARIAHLEHSVRFLQEQHRLMLSGLHTEIEALRERNRDLQFQLIFNKESSAKTTSAAAEENAESNEETDLKREVARLEREAAAARGEARAAEARALQLQRLVDTQAEKLRELELKSAESPSEQAEPEDETRAELRARLAEAERLVRRLRGDAERQRREVLAAATDGVTNLLFDGAHATHAHLQCMKNSLHASLRASGLGGLHALEGYGYQNTYHFPPLHGDYWREREEYAVGASRGQPRTSRRPLTLPELAGQQVPRATIYANHHARPRGNGYEHRNKKGQGSTVETVTSKAEESPELQNRLVIEAIASTNDKLARNSTYPELKLVVTRLVSHDVVRQAAGEAGRLRPRRPPRKHAPDHT